MAPWLDNTQALLLQGQTAGGSCDHGCHAENNAAMQSIEATVASPCCKDGL